MLTIIIFCILIHTHSLKVLTILRLFEGRLPIEQESFIAYFSYQEAWY